MQAAVNVIDRGRLGTTLVTDSHHKLTGIITDGDIRRLVASGKPFAKLRVEDVMTQNPQTITKNFPAFDALNIMEKHQITVLPIVNPEGVVLGILHLHDILGKGEFKFNET
jgi:arabinose-5-phosphate isomerase